MNPTTPGLSSTVRLVAVPALISLIVTLWRLTGELLGWSARYYNPEAGGAGALVGITWLAPLFGIYFALHLAKAGHRPTSWGKAVGLAGLGALMLVSGSFLQPFLLERSLFLGLIFLWLLGALTGGIQYFGWPQLFRTLLAYGLTARLPVMLIMGLAIRGGWQTHYDATPPGFPEMSWLPKFFWVGLLPQLLFWIGFTIAAGAFFGTPAAAVLQRIKPTSKNGLPEPRRHKMRRR
jgi:hypothetical protein